MTSDNEKPDDEHPEVIDPKPREETSTAVAIRHTALQVEAREMNAVVSWGKLMDASGFFPDTQSAAQAAVKILAGREMGFSTIASMTGIFILDGKPVIGAGLMAQAVKRSVKYDYRVLELNAEICRIEFFQRDDDNKWETIGVSEFNENDAVTAGLGQRSASKPNLPTTWEKYPRNMLFARCMSNGIAFYCPDVFETRVYTPDEIRPDIELNEQGDVVDMGALLREPRGDIDDIGRKRPPAAQQPQGQAAGNRAPRPQQQRQQAAASDDDLPNPGAVARWAHERYGLQPSEVDRILGARLATFAGRENEARDTIIAAQKAKDAAAAIEEGALPSPDTYAWYEDFHAAMGEFDVDTETVMAKHGIEVDSDAPVEASYREIDAFLAEHGMTAREMVAATQVEPEEPEPAGA